MRIRIPYIFSGCKLLLAEDAHTFIFTLRGSVSDLTQSRPTIAAVIKGCQQRIGRGTAVRLGEGKIIAPQAFAVEEGGHDRLQRELRHQIENACSADRFAIFVWPWPLRSGQFKCA